MSGLVIHWEGRRLTPHRHTRAEEVYVILAGTGRIKLDDELRDVRALDAIRVRPDVARALEAGPDGLEFLAVGPHHQGDGEPVDDPWVANRSLPRAASRAR